jgi:hypothetical protein
MIWFQSRGDLLHDYKDVEASFPGNEPQRVLGIVNGRRHKSPR